MQINGPLGWIVAMAQLVDLSLPNPEALLIFHPLSVNKRLVALPFPTRRARTVSKD